MTLKKAISIVRSTPKASIGKTLREKGARRIGSGLDRIVYAFPRSRFVIKVESGNYQTENEVRTINTILSDPTLTHFVGVVPKLYFYHLSKGVIVMERLYRVGSKYRSVRLENRLRKLPSGFSVTTDLHDENVGVTLTGKVKILDFGMVCL